MYSRITTPVPMASERGRLRFGFFTSPAVNVTLFQASAEKSEPTCATARIVNTPTNGPAAVPLAECGRSRQKLPKFADIASALRATKAPANTSPASADTLAMVKMFCTAAQNIFTIRSEEHTSE